MQNCPHCGVIHQTTCQRIKSIEYHDNGVTVKKIEFHAPQPVPSPTIHPIFGEVGEAFAGLPEHHQPTGGRLPRS
jgi:hypothetical protein